jgi:rod shape-determining protein MreC
MRLNNISTTSRVKPGDVIESAGIDGVYPRGVVVGRVASVARGSDLFLEIRVTPAVSFSQLTDVLVLAPSPAAASAPGRPGSAGP